MDEWMSLFSPRYGSYGRLAVFLDSSNGLVPSELILSGLWASNMIPCGGGGVANDEYECHMNGWHSPSIYRQCVFPITLIDRP